MNETRAILTSFLDEDLYKITMGYVIFRDFPTAIVTYEFFNRGKTEFPDGFAEALIHQINCMSDLSMTLDEFQYLKSLYNWSPDYLEFLKNYKFDPNEVEVTQFNGTLSIRIKGLWYRTIFWEVRLMAIVSELYFLMTYRGTPSEDYMEKILDKATRMEENNCKWADFGTRRRHSLLVQESVVRLMKSYTGFLGTSNVYLAMKYDVKPIGTSAHEMVMGLSAKFNANAANRMWSHHWYNNYFGAYGIALTDTFTTDVFLKEWDGYWANIFDGVRQDSGDPYEWADKMLAHYLRLGIDPKTKKFVFSNALTDRTFIEISNRYSGNVQVIGGIGTFLTNDCGYPPLNIVIKMTTADFGTGPLNVVKLSDDKEKHTGVLETINETKRQLKLI